MTGSLTLLLIIAVVETPQGPKLTKKTSARSIGTYYFVEIVSVFFINFKLSVMNWLAFQGLGNHVWLVPRALKVFV